MKTLSRREALRASASALALASIPVAAIAALPVEHPDSALLALEAEWHAATKAESAASVAVDEAEGSTPGDERGDAWHRAMHPAAVVIGGRWYCPSENEIAWHCQPLDPNGPSVRQRDKLIARMRRNVAEHKRARAEVGLTPLYDAYDAVRHRRDELAWAIIDAQAATYAGVAVKARIMQADCEHGETDETPRFLASIIADLERLAARA